MIVWLEPKVEFRNTSRRKKKKKNEWQLHVFLATFHRYYFLDFYLIIDILFLKYQLYTEKFMNPKWSSLMNYYKNKYAYLIFHQSQELEPCQHFKGFFVILPLTARCLTLY